MRMNKNLIYSLGIYIVLATAFVLHYLQLIPSSNSAFDIRQVFFLLVFWGLIFLCARGYKKTSLKPQGFIKTLNHVIITALRYVSMPFVVLSLVAFILLLILMVYLSIASGTSLGDMLR